MAKKNTSNLVSAILYILIGVLLVIFKSEMLNWLMTIAGVFFLISGIIDVIKKNYMGGAVSIIIGVAILILGWLATKIVLLVFGLLIAIKGLIALIEEFKRKKLSAFGILFAILTMVAGIMLAFGDGLNILVLICGIFFIIDGVLGLIGALTSK
jgi:uncharacterized membrane protein HdeD (DUF308 family)